MFFHQLFTCPVCREDPRTRRDAYCAKCEKVTIYVSTKDARPYYLCRLCYPDELVHDILAKPDELRFAKLSRGTAPSDPRGYVLHLFHQHPVEFCEWLSNTYHKQSENKKNPILAVDLLKRWRPWIFSDDTRPRMGDNTHNSLCALYSSAGVDMAVPPATNFPNTKRTKLLDFRPYQPPIQNHAIVDLRSVLQGDVILAPVPPTNIKPESLPVRRKRTSWSRKPAVVTTSISVEGQYKDFELEAEDAEGEFNSDDDDANDDEDDEYEGSGKKKQKSSKLNSLSHPSPAPSTPSTPLMRALPFEYTQTSVGRIINNTNNDKSFSEVTFSQEATSGSPRMTTTSILSETPTVKTRRLRDEIRKLQIELEHTKTYIQKINRTRPIWENAVAEVKALKTLMAAMQEKLFKSEENIKQLKTIELTSEKVTSKNNIAPLAMEPLDITLLRENLVVMVKENSDLRLKVEEEKDKREEMESYVTELKYGLKKLLGFSSSPKFTKSKKNETFRKIFDDVLNVVSDQIDDPDDEKTEVEETDLDESAFMEFVLAALQTNVFSSPSNSNDSTLQSDDFDSLHLDVDLDIDDVEKYDGLQNGTFFNQEKFSLQISSELDVSHSNEAFMDKDLPSSVVVPLF
ncbi:hypothetical protein HK096_004700 [Nowakowskiella sp. JEL0078]|nr:hypothetical protein HK096_004700 [Nowakowskiella sp. JEL0078]